MVVLVEIFTSSTNPCVRNNWLFVTMLHVLECLHVYLEYSGNDSVWYLSAVLLPVLPVFTPTSFLIAERSVVKQNAHEEKVRPGQEMREATSSTHGPRLHQICQIIGMSGHSPPTRSEQNALVFFSVTGVVLAAYELCWFAPDLTFAILASNIISFIICGTEYGISSQTNTQNWQGLSLSEVGWISCKILRLEGIQSR